MVSDLLGLGYSGGPGTSENCSGYTFEQGGLSGLGREGQHPGTGLKPGMELG